MISLKVFKSINTKIIVSEYESVSTSNNKYLLMEQCSALNIPVGKYYIVNNKMSENNNFIAIDRYETYMRVGNEIQKKD